MNDQNNSDNPQQEPRVIHGIRKEIIFKIIVIIIIGGVFVGYKYFSANKNFKNETVEKEISENETLTSNDDPLALESDKEEDTDKLKYKELLIEGPQLSMSYPENWNVYDLNDSQIINKVISPIEKDLYSKVISGIRILGQGTSIISGAEEWNKLEELSDNYYRTVTWEHNDILGKKQREKIEISGIKMLKTKIDNLRMRNNRLDKEYEVRNFVYYHFNINTTFLVLEYSYPKEDFQTEEIYKKMIESIVFEHISDRNYNKINISDDLVKFRSKNDSDYKVNCDNVSKSGFGLSPPYLKGTVSPGEKLNPSIWILKQKKEEGSVFEYSVSGDDILDFIFIEDGFVYKKGDSKTQIIFNIEIPQDIKSGVYTGVIQIKEMCQQLGARIEVELTVVEEDARSVDDLDRKEVKGGFDPRANPEKELRAESKEDTDLSVILDFIKNHDNSGITINEVTSSQNDIELVISGHADTRDNLLRFKSFLENSDYFSEIFLPMGNLLNKEDIDFSIKVVLL